MEHTGTAGENQEQSTKPMTSYRIELGTASRVDSSRGCLQEEETRRRRRSYPSFHDFLESCLEGA